MKTFRGMFAAPPSRGRQLLLVVMVAAVFTLYLGGSDVSQWVNNWRAEGYLTGPTVERRIGYLVDTEGCSIPQYDPRDPSIARLIKAPAEIACNPTGKPPLSYTSGPTIHINMKPTVLARYRVTHKQLQCCIQDITRLSDSLTNFTKDCDNKYSLSRCRVINVTTGVSENVTAEGALVSCFRKTSSRKLIYQNVHYFFHKNKVEKKIKDYKDKLQANGSQMLNFFIVGIDSTSRQNLQRYMPKTFNYLTNLPDVVDFVGYNKVSDNTDLNLSPILMGTNAEDFYAYRIECFKYRGDNFDECPLIWKNFSSRGYVTVFAEDAPGMGLYHYKKVGFVNEPTDYYNRPSFLVSEKKIGHIKTQCQGLLSSAEVIYDHALRSMDTFSRDVPMFGYFWTASITHDSNENAAALDAPTVKFFKRFISEGYHNNSIVLFISDHGMRFGNIRSTYLGALEERMPFITMMFPPWFKEVYPATWQNMMVNRNRLINNYDLHATLLDIVSASFLESSNPKTFSGRGQSLFLEIPSNRTCESIFIPTHYCTCQTSSAADVSDAQVIKGAEFVLKNINHGLSGNPACAELQLETVLHARISEHRHNWTLTMSHNNNKIWKTYSVTIQTTPGGGQFEATVLLGASGWLLSDDVSRINLYGNQSYCEPDSVLKKFCFCS